MLINILLQEGQGGGGMMQMIFLVGMIAVFYFFMIRPQRKKQKDAKIFREALKKGDNVITIGGIIGKVSSFEEEYVYIEIDRGIKAKFSRSAIDAENTKKLNPSAKK